MRRRRAGVLLALCAITVITAFDATASAQEGYTGACVLGVSDPSPDPGETVTVTGDNFPLTPNTVPIMIDNPTQQIGTAHIDASGHFSDQATIPADLSPGTHEISVSCASTGVDSSTTVDVLGGSLQTNDAPLARTGSDPQPLVLMGLGAVAVGIALVLTGRRRRAQRLAT